MCKCNNLIKTPYCGRGDCVYPKPYADYQQVESKLDPVVEAVRADLHSRSKVGINKYGTTLAENKGDLRYWLQHAYEECLDQANYLKRAIMELDSKEIKITVEIDSKKAKEIVDNAIAEFIRDNNGNPSTPRP